MQSRGPVWWLLYAAGAIVAFMLAGRLVALIFGSFFSLLIVEEHLDRAALSNGQYVAETSDGDPSILRAVIDPRDMNASPVAVEPPATLPGGVRPLTEADLNGEVPPYLETPATRPNGAR